MKEYLKMGDVFVGVYKAKSRTETYPSCRFGEKAIELYGVPAEYAVHAINSHDELVSKLDVAESTIYEVERVLSEMQRNGAFGLDDVIAEVECCIKRLSE